MARTNTAKHDLDFLKHLKSDRLTDYKSASWLKSAFEEKSWVCEFGTQKFKIEFEVHLEDKSLLTDEKNTQLLEVFKCWMCVQTHFDATGRILIGEATAFHRVSKVLRFIDYFLLHAPRLRLAEFGLQALSSSEIKTFFYELSESSTTANSLHKWNHRLAEYLKDGIACLSKSELGLILANNPDIALISETQEERVLDLTDEELITARAVLYSRGLYKYSPSEGYRYSPSSIPLSKLIYPDSLWLKKSAKPIPEELLFSPIEGYQREFPAVPVKLGNADRLSVQLLMEWQLTFRTLGLLGELNLPIPKPALDALSDASFTENLRLKEDGRFRTLPQELVFDSLKNAVEFSLEYGNEIITAYLRLAEEAKKNSTTIAGYCVDSDITPLLSIKLRDIGVKRWHLTHFMANIESNPNKAKPLPRSSDTYFKRFRSNEGLYELLVVLYGAIQICVGTLTARRQGELADLIAGSCLDKSRKYIVFENRKSGIAGMRDKEARPIPDICQQLIGMLETLQFGLIKIGALDAPTRLFSRPNPTNLSLSLTHVSYSASFDYFSDYFQTAVTRNGQRYYFRQHQLRRFFSMLFFWGRSFGGMDTLRWFLGHTDMEHLYHYITESMTGATLRWAKASFCVSEIKNQSDTIDSLANLVGRHFSTPDFSVLDSEELEEYIYELITEGAVRVEPVFFSTPQGKDYKVIVKVLREDQ